MSGKRTQTKNNSSAHQTKKKSSEPEWFNLEDQEDKKYQNLKNKVKSSKYGLFRQPKSRMILIGDIHGDFEALETILVEEAEVLEKKVQNNQVWYRWIGQKTWIVCLGDLIDRCREESLFELEDLFNYATQRNEKIKKTIGEDAKSEMKVLDLLNMTMIEAEKTGGKLIKIIGNHDFENIPSSGTFFYARYSSPFFYHQTLNTLYQNQKITLANYQGAWTALKSNGSKTDQVKTFLRYYYFGIDNLLNCKLRAGNAFLVVQIGDWVMAHGGILRNMIEYYYDLHFPKLKVGLKDVLVRDERLTKYNKSKNKRNLFDYLQKYDPAIDKFVQDLKKFENPWIETLSGNSWIQVLNQTFYKYIHGKLDPEEKDKFRKYLLGEYLGSDSLIYDRSLGDHACQKEEELSQYHFELYQKIIKLQLFHFKKQKNLKIAIAHCPQIINSGLLSQSYLPNKSLVRGRKRVSSDWIETRIDNRKDPRYTYYSGISGDLPDLNNIPRLWRLDVAYSRAFDSSGLKALVQNIENGSLDMFPSLVRLLHARAPQCLEVNPQLEPRVLAANPLRINRPWLQNYPKTVKLLERYINDYPLYPENPPYLIKMK